MKYPLKKFIQTHLDPGDRLGEVLFGLIMALGFTAAVRLGQEEPDNRSLFLEILGCNIAWGIVDGVMYVLGEMFERGRQARIIQGVVSAPSEEKALETVGAEMDDRLGFLFSAEERRQIYRRAIASAKRTELVKPGLRRADLMGGMAVGLVVIVATFPIVAPYLIFANPHLAVRISNLIGLILLFLLGASWGRHAGGTPWRVGLGLVLLGLVLVGITIALGG
jgi:VIT1/CCC1 family predicted Fe2+/Mn2+ transporter